jgi:hypothetical protein
MASFEYDLNYLQAGEEVFEEYLLSSDLYWPVGIKAHSGSPPYPRLTLGGMLLAQVRAHALAHTSEEQAELVKIDERLDALRDKWRVAWEKKATHEIRARLKLWSDFLSEYREHPDNNVDRYGYEVNRRVLLHLLKPDARISEVERDLIDTLDDFLKAALVPGDFVWDDDLAVGFPPDPYWYLYSQLRGKID